MTQIHESPKYPVRLTVSSILEFIQTLKIPVYEQLTMNNSVIAPNETPNSYVIL